MDYIKELNYSLFLCNRVKDDILNEAIVMECVLKSQGERNAQTMRIVNEGFVDKAKALLLKIANKIGTIWKKFLETMDRTFKNTNGYLMKYKDIILRKKFDESATLTMYDYETGMEKMKRAKVEKFNYETMKNDLESEEKFQATLSWANFSSTVDKNKFEDKLKSLFRGGEKEKTFKGSDLNMSNIFDYCINYKNLKKELQSDIDIISESTKEALALIETIEEELEEKESKEEKNESGIYTDTFYSFINELDITSDTKDGDSVSSVDKKLPSGEIRKDDAKSFAGSNKNISDEEDDAAKQREENNKKHITTDMTKEDKDENGKDKERAQKIKEIQDRIQVYDTVCGKVLAVKQTICEEIFREYMSIIKYHVKYNLGKEKDSESNKTQDSYKDYSYKDKKENKDNKEVTNKDNKKEEPKDKVTGKNLENIINGGNGQGQGGNGQEQGGNGQEQGAGSDGMARVGRVYRRGEEDQK